MMNNMAVKERNKLQNQCKVLIVVAKCSKFESESTTV